jgi:hypothetical protein
MQRLNTITTMEEAVLTLTMMVMVCMEQQPMMDIMGP